MCGRSCVRGFCFLLCCGAKLVPLPLSRAGTPGCGRGGTAQGRGRVGTLVRERSRSGGGGRRARRAPHPPQRPQAGARARGVSPPPPRRAPTGRRAWPCPRPPRARATPNGRAGRERAAAAARAPGRSREPGAPRGPLPGLSRPSVSSPRARRAFPAPARVSSLARTGGGIYLAAGATRKREEVFGSGSRSAAFTGSKGGAAKARMSGSNNYCFFLSPRCVPSTVLSNLCGSLYSHNGPAR